MTKIGAGVALVLSLMISPAARAQSAWYVQINTSAGGQDVPADAANEPSIAVDPTDPNRMAVGWRQFDTVTSDFRQAGVGFTTDGGRTWITGVLTPGAFRTDPVLRSDAGGTFYYSSLNSLFAADVFTSTDGGATWGAPVPAYGGDKQWIAVDTSTGPGRGHVYQHWNVQFSSVPDTSFNRSTDGGASFGAPTVGPRPYSKWGTLAVGPDGTLHAAGSDLGQTTHVFASSTNAQRADQTPTFTTRIVDLGGRTGYGDDAVNPDGLLGQVNVAAANNGDVYVLASVDPPGADPLDVMFIRSVDGGSTWTEPVRVNGNAAGENSYQWFGTMSVAPGGRIDAIWNDTGASASNDSSVLTYAYSPDRGTTWLGHVPLTPAFDQKLGYPLQNKIGDYYDMWSDDAGASVVFSATFTGGQDVYYMRITAVPEPTSLGLVAAGAAALVALRRRGREPHRTRAHRTP